MAINKWQPGTLYLTGALVLPTATAGATPTTIPNASFDLGDSDWTKGTGWAINTNLAFDGTYSAEYSGPGAADLESTTKHPVSPGKAITATCFVHQGASNDGEASAAVFLRWYDAVDALISTSTGNAISYGDVGIWHKSTVSATAPPTAAKVAIGCTAYNDWAALNVDGFAWNYILGAAATGVAYQALADIGTATYGPATDVAFANLNEYDDLISVVSAGLIDAGFKAGSTLNVAGSTSNDGTYDITIVNDNGLWVRGDVLTNESNGASVTLTQDANTLEAGTSGSIEPDWPGTIGSTVQDGTVTWLAVAVDSVTWEASSVLTSGQNEPTWPTVPGSYTFDNNIAWETVPLRITDEKCPHSKVVAIAASKIFAGDTDVVRFSATLNARDWSTEDDAGFLPSGLQQKSQVGVDAMGVYRGNLAVWSASTFQVWQVDPDPAAMALLDAMEGIGSIYQQAVQPVSDDLFFLSALGVRTVAIAEGTNNLATGDVGVPIDTLVQAEKNAVDVEPIASYYPGAGQYWLAFRPLTIVAGLLAGQFLLTSPIYPIGVEDAVQQGTSASYGRLFGAWAEDAITTTTKAVRGTNPMVHVEYRIPDDAVIQDTAESYGTMGGDVVIYTYFEDAVIQDTAVGSGTILGALIVYPNFEDGVIGSTSASYGTIETIV